MDFKDLQAKAKDELKELLATTTKELRVARAKAKLGQLKQVHTVSKMRTMIARIQTLLKV